jgi:hypothetical protein
MGAVEHLKTLCCLGLKPESAMIAVTPLLHEIIPHGWTRIWQMAPDATCIRGYGEHPETGVPRAFMDLCEGSIESCFPALWTCLSRGRHRLASAFARTRLA